MSMRRAWLGSVMLVLALASTARGQTTQPAESWSDAIARLSDALRGTDLAALAKVLEASSVHTFSSDTLLPSDRLLATTSGTNVLGLHAYLKVPTSLATDLSDDFKSADVPDNLRRDMVVSDSAGERIANDTAARWVAQTLRPGGEQAIGVIVLWRREKSDKYTSASFNRPVFIVVKADVLDGHYSFRQLIVGDPLEKKR